ncbi:MAG TPA: hexose kinase [Actinomycetota bacterium]|nr:hexose kinase [Actinomycetota bacterium]
MSRPIVVVSPNLSLDRTNEVASLRHGHVHRAIAVDVRGGGKGANVARALAAVGRSCTLIGLVAGRTGTAVDRLLEDEGIHLVSIPCPGETRSCLTVLDDAGTTVFNEPGPPHDPRAWEALEAEVDASAVAGGVVVLSGSFPPGTPPEAAAGLVRSARARGCQSICDTSGPHLKAALRAGPDVVTPNLAEARAVLEGDEGEAVDPGADGLASAASCAAALVDQGAASALVTAGPLGAAGVLEGHRVDFPAHRVTVRNPVGAGDCLVAGMAACLAEGAGLGPATRFGIALAAASCETLAAGALDRKRAEELLARTP